MSGQESTCDPQPCHHLQSLQSLCMIHSFLLHRQASEHTLQPLEATSYRCAKSATASSPPLPHPCSLQCYRDFLQHHQEHVVVSFRQVHTVLIMIDFRVFEAILTQRGRKLERPFESAVCVHFFLCISWKALVSTEGLTVIPVPVATSAILAVALGMGMEGFKLNFNVFFHK